MFKKLKPEDLNQNIFDLIGKKWLLITAGTPEKYNMMTASWSGMGILWNKPVVFIFVRPNRYTYQFLEEQAVFSLNILSDCQKEILMTCGTKSGLEINKMAIQGLTSFITDQNCIGFQEAEQIFNCRKLYFQDIDPKNFLDQTINNLYPINDYHRMYVAEIEEILIK